MKGKVRPFIRVEPGRVSFRGFPETLDEKVIEINTNSESFRVLGVETKLKDKIDYQLETVEEGKKYRLKVKNLVQREGQYRGNITIKTDHPKKDKVVIRVAAYLEGEIFVKPRVISVGKFNPQKPVRTGKVVVVNNLGNPFQITKKTYDEKLLDVVESPLPDPKKKGFVLEITPKFDNATQKNRKSTSLTFQTDLSNKEHKVRIHLIHRK